MSGGSGNGWTGVHSSIFTRSTVDLPPVDKTAVDSGLQEPLKNAVTRGGWVASLLIETL